MATLVRVRHKFLRQGVADAALNTALPAPKVTRVLFEQHGIKEVTEKVAGDRVAEGRAVALAEPFGALAVAGKLIVPLANARLNAHGRKDKRIERTLHEEVKFLVRG
jgi:hypothetical protein